MIDLCSDFESFLSKGIQMLQEKLIAAGLWRSGSAGDS